MKYLASIFFYIMILFPMASYALTTLQEKMITGITCGVSENGSWLTLSLKSGGYFDMVGNYAWIQFQDKNQLTVKVFKRRPLISSAAGLVKDDLIMKYTHTLDNLETYSDFDKLFEVDFDIDIDYNQSTLNFINPLKMFKKKKFYRSRHYKLSCQIVKGHDYLSKLYLNNTIHSRFIRNERSHNHYKGIEDYETRKSLKDLEEKYEAQRFKKK